MLDTNTNIKLGNNSFSSPSTEILQRSNPNSTFLRLQRGSEMEKWLFPDDGSNSYIKRGRQEIKIDVIVLQILVFESNNYLIEILEKAK